MKRTAIVFLSIVMAVQQSFAECEFTAADPEAVSLSRMTETTLTGMLESKNACSAAFSEAVRSAQGLPELISASKSPIQMMEKERMFVMSEIANALSDPNQNTGPVEGFETYVDFLYSRKTKIERQISEARAMLPAQRKEESKEKLVSMARNLMEAASNALDDPKSDCAKNLSKNFGSSILTIGMGALSAASPFSMVTGASMGGLLAGLLSHVFSIFQKMPPDPLKNFVSTKDTLDLACLYQSIVKLSCTMKQNIEGGPRSSIAKENLRKQASQIRNAPTYSAVLTSKEIQTDLETMMAAVARNSKDAISGQGNFSNEISELFGEGRKSSSQDVVDKQLRQFQFFDRYMKDNGALLNSLKTDEKSSFNMGLQMFIIEIKNGLESSGTPIQLKDSQGNTYAFTEIFKKHRDAIESYLKQRKTEISGGETSTILALEEATEIKQAVNSEKTLEKIGYLLKSNQQIRTYIQENSLKSVDWAALNYQLNASDKALADFAEWLKLSPTQFPDYKDYRSKLKELGGQFAKNLTLKSGDIFEIKEKLQALMTGPYVKFQNLASVRNAQAVDSLLENPFKTNRSELTEFEKYKTVRDLFNTLEDSNTELRDAHSVNESRRLFEDPNSPLRQTFSQGLAGMISRISSSPDPAIARRMVNELCGLAYSLPGSSGHAISDCQELMPPRMKQSLKEREAPDCNYQRYLEEKSREDLFKTGRKPSLPHPTGVK